MAYSFPNPADDLKTQVAYAVGAEFIYRLDLFLQNAYDKSKDGSVTLDTLDTLHDCCEAALDLVGQFDWRSSKRPSFDAPSITNPSARQMSGEVVEVLEGMLQVSTQSEGCTARTKQELMCILSGEFFLRVGCLAEAVQARSGGSVSEEDALVLLGCIDAAMGMLYEVAEVNWADSHPVPARAILPMHGHVTSERLYYSGEEAVRLIEAVYQVVVDRVMRDD